MSTTHRAIHALTRAAFASWGEVYVTFATSLIAYATDRGILNLPVTVAMVEAANAIDQNLGCADFARGRGLAALRDLIRTIARRLPDGEDLQLTRTTESIEVTLIIDKASGYSAPLVVEVADDELDNDEGWTSTLVNLEISLDSVEEARRFVEEHRSLLGSRLEWPDNGSFVHCGVVNRPNLLDELEDELNGSVEIEAGMWGPPAPAPTLKGPQL